MMLSGVRTGLTERDESGWLYLVKRCRWSVTTRAIAGRQPSSRQGFVQPCQVHPRRNIPLSGGSHMLSGDAVGGLCGYRP
jgi:hypothetical protein